MTMLKHEIPILEFDSARDAVIMPDHKKSGFVFPQKCVFPFLGDKVEEYAQKHHAREVGFFQSATKRYPVYAVEYKGETVGLCQAPVGAPAAVMLMDWLMGYGVESVISAGSCGSLIDMEENVFVVPVKALRDEGTSYHYMAPSRYVETCDKALRAIEKTLNQHNLPHRAVTTWTTDAFYRETREKIIARKAEGCHVVDMECAALCACAAFRGKTFGQLLFTADSLSDVEKYDERGFGLESWEYALELCLDTLVNLD